MRRTKFLALALVVAIMLMGAGYAAWTERIEIDGTVKTGEVDVSIVTRENGDWELPRAEIGRFNFGNLNSNNKDHWITEQRNPQDYAEQWVGATSKVNQHKKHAKFKFTNLYPGAEVQYVIRLQNQGTLPAKITSIAVDPQALNHVNDNFLLDNLDVKWELKRAMPNTGDYLDVATGYSEDLGLLKKDLEDVVSNAHNQEDLTLYPIDPALGNDKKSDLRLILRFIVDDSEFVTQTYNTENDSTSGLLNKHKGENDKIELGVTFDFNQAPEAPKQ